MGALTAYRRVLRNPALARLLIGEFVSSIGDWLYLVALLVVVYAESGDPVVLGIIGAARVLPYVLLSVPAGIAADRYDRRLILLSTDIIRGLIMVVIAAIVLLNGPTILVVVLAVLATCFSAFFSPAIGAFLPSLVKDESELGTGQQPVVEPGQPGLLRRPDVRGHPAGLRPAAARIPA